MCYTASMDQQDKDSRFEKLEHRQELLENKVESEMKILQVEREKAQAESDSAIERLRVTIAEQSKDVIKFIATMSVGIVAVLGAFIAILQFYK